MHAKIKIGHRANFRAKYKCSPQISFPVRAILRSINFRCTDFRWFWPCDTKICMRTHLVRIGVTRARHSHRKLKLMFSPFGRSVPSLKINLISCCLRTFAPIVSAHPYCARESHATSCHAMHRARALSTKMNK